MSKLSVILFYLILILGFNCAVSLIFAYKIKQIEKMILEIKDKLK